MTGSPPVDVVVVHGHKLDARDLLNESYHFRLVKASAEMVTGECMMDGRLPVLSL
jgi:hypothetical protein